MTRRTGSALALVLGVLAAGAVASYSLQSAAPAGQAPAVTPMDESRRVQAADIDRLLADGKTVLLDVREAKELEELGTLPDAIHIPLGQLEKRMGELPKDRVILTA